MKIVLPKELNLLLVTDRDLVQKEHHVLNVPASVSADMIFMNFREFKKSTCGSTPNRDSVYLELTEGIRDYFNTTLGTKLLYSNERPQYLEMVSKKQPMSELYGFIHLLRLFVKLGEMLDYTPLDKKSSTSLLNHIHDFITYLNENRSQLFKREDYVLLPSDNPKDT